MATALKFWYLTIVVLSCCELGSATEQTSTGNTNVGSISAVEIYRRAGQSVALLEVIASNGNVTSSGSGFFIAPRRFITNYHVIERAERMRVRLSNGWESTAISVVSTDPIKDLALLEVERAIPTPALILACESRPEVGQTVFALGNPLGILEGTFSQGLISGVRQLSDRNLIQTSAPISHGSSGGPLLNEIGEVVGIAEATLGGGQNLNFAVPVADACRLVSILGEPQPLEQFFGERFPANQAPDAEPLRKASNGLDPRWLAADKEKVLSDPNFYHLGITQREKILAEIDEDFRRLSSEKKHSYLWRAETDHLPKPNNTDERLVWDRTTPGSTLEFGPLGEIIKVLSTITVEVKVSSPDFTLGQFAKLHVSIRNKSGQPLEIKPQTFTLQVDKPKPTLLRFEYPDRVYYESMDLFMKKAYLPEFAGLSSARQDALNLVGSIPRTALSPTLVSPDSAVEGYVYFERPPMKIAAASVLIFIDHTSFLLPFSLSR